MPAEIATVLPVNDAGLPIIVATNAEVEPGVTIELAYDATIDDPIARWGQCLSRVAACYQTNPGPIAGCIDLVERCADGTGGNACCPPGCISAFHSLMASGTDEDTAIGKTFLQGDCVIGFAALRDHTGGTP
jgi:hypothetical protein